MSHMNYKVLAGVCGVDADSSFQVRLVHMASLTCTYAPLVAWPNSPYISPPCPLPRSSAMRTSSLHGNQQTCTRTPCPQLPLLQLLVRIIFFLLLECCNCSCFGARGNASNGLLLLAVLQLSLAPSAPVACLVFRAIFRAVFVIFVVAAVTAAAMPYFHYTPAIRTSPGPAWIRFRPCLMLLGKRIATATHCALGNMQISQRPSAAAAASI